MSISHLNNETRRIIEGSLEDRVRWVQEDHFVYYPKAQACIEELSYLMWQQKNRAFPSDLDQLSIIGESGVGKSSIIREFMQLHPINHYKDHETYPVAYCILRNSITGLGGLYTALLSAFNHPFANPGTRKYRQIKLSELEDTLISTLKRAKTKLFFIDEFQHAIGRHQQALIDQIKRTMLVSQVPFIPVGTPEVENILNLDFQLADRCPVKKYSRLDNWEYNEEFQSFIEGYEKALPFPEPSGLASEELTSIIFKKVKFPHLKETNLRHITRFVKKVATRALLKSHDKILKEDIIETRN